MKKIKRERRKPVLCPNCNQPMICINKYAAVDTKTSRGIYMWYVCPRRAKKGEKGCGFSVLMENLPGREHSKRTVCAIEFKKLKSKKKG